MHNTIAPISYSAKLAQPCCDRLRCPDELWSWWVSSTPPRRFFLDRGGCASSAPCTALVSSTHAGRDPRIVKHEHFFFNEFDVTDMIVHIVMPVCTYLFFGTTTSDRGELVNAHSLVDGSKIFSSRAAGREFPVLHMHIDAPRGERSALRCTQWICIHCPTFHVSSLRLSNQRQV